MRKRRQEQTAQENQREKVAERRYKPQPLRMRGSLATVVPPLLSCRPLFGGRVLYGCRHGTNQILQAESGPQARFAR